MISIVPPVETMGQSSVQKGEPCTCTQRAPEAPLPHRCVQQHHGRPRFALVPLIVPTSTIGDRIHIIMEGPCSISHVTRRATASHGQRLAILPRIAMRAIPPHRVSRENEPRVSQIPPPSRRVRIRRVLSSFHGRMIVDQRRKTRQHGGDRCIDDVAGGTAKRQTFDDRVHAYRRARACKAIEQRMIQFVRPMSLSGGTPCHGVRRARAQIGFDLTPRVLPRITH